MSHMNHLNHLKIPLQVIQICTLDFDERNFIGNGGYGKVYKGILSWAEYKDQLVAVKRLDAKWGQGKKEFYTEIVMLSQYKHKNIITFIGFCDDSNEMILVYEYACHGSLDKYLRDDVMLGQLSWPRRLNICIGVASALNYLHNHVGETHIIIHRDIKSANILLDKNWNAKLSDFGFCKVGVANQENTFLITHPAGTPGYCDPEYQKTGILTKESDVYSLGVVLFEVLCGRLVCVNDYHDERRFLHHLARTCYQEGRLESIVDLTIKDHINHEAFRKFSHIAYKCIQEATSERPMIFNVVGELKNAKRVQEMHNSSYATKAESGLSPTAAALLIQMSFWIFMLKKNRSSPDAVLCIQMMFVSQMTKTSRKYSTNSDAILLMQPTFQILKNRKADNLSYLVNYSDPITTQLNALLYDGTYHDETHEEVPRLVDTEFVVWFYVGVLCIVMAVIDAYHDTQILEFFSSLPI